MRFFRLLLVTVLVTASSLVPVGAATYVIEETIDLEILDLSRPVNLAQPLTSNVGPVFDDDRLDITVNFANNRSLRLDQGGGFGLSVIFTSGVGTEITPSNFSFELFDLVTNGSFDYATAIGNQYGGFAEGRVLLASDLGIEEAGSFIQFSGMRMVFDIALADDDPNLFFDRLGFQAINPSLADTSVIPVPAAAWLFASGLLCLAGISRRRP